MPKSKPLKLFKDTNLWISFIISNKLNLLDPLLFNDKARLLFSEDLIDEIQQTTSKPKLQKYFKKNSIQKMFSAFESYIDFIDVRSSIEICRDPKDNFLLSLARDGKADYLLTGDKDLLELKNFGSTKIRTIASFIVLTKKTH